MKPRLVVLLGLVALAAVSGQPAGAMIYYADGTDNTSVTTGLLPNQDLFILANNTGGTAGQFSATEVSIFLLGVAAPSKLTQLDDEWDDYFQSL